jgi:hypothetical protein
MSCDKLKPKLHLQINLLNLLQVSPDGNMVLFLPQREIMVTETKVEPLMGVALIHQSVMKTTSVKVFLQVVLTFR